MRTLKITLGVFGVLALLVLILPFAMGFVIHNKYTHVIEALNTPNVKIKLLDFKRGWFNSEANVLVSIEPVMPQFNNQKPQAVTPVQFKVAQKITHGPFILNIKHDGKVDNLYFAQASIQSTIKQNDASTTSDLIVHINGDIDGTMQPLSFTVKQPNANISADKISSDIQIFDNGERFKMRLNVPKFDITNNRYTQTLSDIAISTDINKYNRYNLWLGHESIKVGSLVFAPKQQKPTTISDIYIATDSDEVSHKIHSIVRASIQSIQNDQGKYGPHKLNLTLSNIDAKTYFNLNHKIIAMQNDGTFTPQEMREALGYTLDLLSHGIDINMSVLSITTPNGKLNAEAQVDIPSTPPTQNALFSLFGSLKANFKVNISKSLVMTTLEKMYRNKQKNAAANNNSTPKESPKKQAQDEIAQLVAKGWLIEARDEYTINLKYGKGKLLVNDKPPQALKNGTEGQPLERIKQKLMQNNA